MSPVRQGVASTSSLNAALQEQLNPGGFGQQELSKKGWGTVIPQVLRTGDKVLQRVNNYDKDVYNGDIGFVEEVSVIEQLLTVRYAIGSEGRSCFPPLQPKLLRYQRFETSTSIPDLQLGLSSQSTLLLEHERSGWSCMWPQATSFSVVPKFHDVTSGFKSSTLCFLYSSTAKSCVLSGSLFGLPNCW